jgi:chromosome segregation ATPase
MADEQLLETISTKIDALADEVRTITYRMDKSENRFDKLENRFESLETRFDSMDRKMDGLTDIVRDIAGNVKTLSNQFGSVVSKVIENDIRLEKLEVRVGDLETQAH